jgi:plasmid stability protein
MPTITVRNVPDAVVRRLKARAERNRRSLSGEVVSLLEEATLEAPENVEGLLAEADSWFAHPLPDLVSAGKRTGRKGEGDGSLGGPLASSP